MQWVLLQQADRNVAVGKDALAAFIASGDQYATAIGFNAMGATTTGGNCTAVGGGALSANTTGSNNTSLGYFALGSNTTAE